jgi:hypothetical protein
MEDCDCLLLNDGCATTSPNFAKQCIEFNNQEGWGFLLSCEDLAKGVDYMKTYQGKYQEQALIGSDVCFPLLCQ